MSRVTRTDHRRSRPARPGHDPPETACEFARVIACLQTQFSREGKFGMKKMKVAMLGIPILAACRIATAQTTQVSRANKTIDVTATETVKADAEVAVLHIGCSVIAGTKGEAYDENVRLSGRVTQALLDAGIAKSDIETTRLRLRRLEADGSSPPAIDPGGGCQDAVRSKQEAGGRARAGVRISSC